MVDVNDANWIPPTDEPLEQIRERLDSYFHHFSWVQKTVDQWELTIPIYAGYAKRDGYLIAHLSLHHDQSFDLASGGYFDDHSYWLYIRKYNHIKDDGVEAHEKAIQLLITTVDDLFQDGNLQIPISRT